MLGLVRMRVMAAMTTRLGIYRLPILTMSLKVRFIFWIFSDRRIKILKRGGVNKRIFSGEIWMFSDEVN